MPPTISVPLLRDLFRNLQMFRAVYEAEGVDTIVSPDGDEICLWDLEHLYAQIKDVLPPRQYQAIEWFLVWNYREATVAEMMGISPTTPVGSYATAGLEKLIVLMAESGGFPRLAIPA